MEILLERARNVLHVIFANVELTEEPFEAALFRRSFGPHEGLTFTFEKNEKGFFLYIGFDRYNDPDVLCQISIRRPVYQLQVLRRLAHLPCAKVFSSTVRLPDGRNVEIIDSVAFELRKAWEGIWDSGGKESEVDRRLRQMRLNRMTDEVPELLSAWEAGRGIAGGFERLFTDVLPEDEPGTTDAGKFQAVSESASRRELGPRVLKDKTPPRPREPQKKLLASIKRALGAAKRETEFKKPTADDVNKAIQLLLWRCRDAEIHRNKPEGKRGFYGLDDWISKADDTMIKELGLWCADIQFLNTGSRDS